MATRRSAGARGRLSGPADRELFHGAAPGRRRGHGRGGHRARGALRQDHPRRIPPPAQSRAGPAARSRSRASSPGAWRWSGDIPLLADPAARVVILTPSAASLAGARRRGPLHPRRARRAARPARGARRAARALRRAHAAVRGRPAPERAAARRRARRRAVPLALPHARGRRSASGGEALRILAGPELSPPVELELPERARARLRPVPALRRAQLRAGERVSRETMLSSSLAR